MSIDTTKIIHAPVGGGRYTVTAPIVKEDYGLYLKIEGLELPSTYEVDFSNSEHNGTSVTMIGNADGVLIPNQFIASGKDVFAFLYHVGDNYGRTVFKFRIPNKLRPDRTNETPTPEEQSTIDQAISALNSAVSATAQDVIDADASAQSASQSAENAHDSAVDAQNYAESASGYASDAQGYATTASQKATEAGNSADQAAQIKTDIEGYVSTAQTAAQTATDKAAQASQSATNASNSATTASTKAGEASASATTASNKAGEASASATTASNKATEASGYANTASQKASDASDSASAAFGYKTDAESAKTAAQTAQGKAEDAQEAAETAAASVSASAAQITTNTADIADLQTDVAQNEADILKAFPTDSASGAIASFPDGADDIPLKSLVVDINPVQNLNGYDSPWVGGGGKNLLEVSEANLEKPSYYSGTWTGTTITDAKENSITVSRTNSQGGFAGVVIPNGLKAGTYAFSCDVPVTASSKSFYIGYTENGVFSGQKALEAVNASNTHPYKSFTLENDTDSFYIKMAGAAGDVPLTFSHLQIEAGSTATSYAPYENLCPISGWTGCEVQRTGVNLLSLVESEMVSSGWNRIFPISLKAGTYIISCQNQFGASTKGAAVALVDDNATTVINGLSGYEFGNSTFVGRTTTITEEEASKIKNLRFSLRTRGATYNDIVQGNIKLELGSTATPYEPYNGTTIPISWQTEAGTVYGGKLDVLTGILTVYPYYDSYNGETLTGEWISDRDKYVAGTTPTIGAQVVNIGAQGVTVQLEPHEVESLYGVNNLWADSGDAEVEYRADTKLYIERLTAPDSADMIADSNITSGKYFMVGNNLYKATANIASGSAVVVGTNAIRKSLSEALNEINA